MQTSLESTNPGFKRTLLAVSRQIHAMGESALELGINQPRRGMLLRNWRTEQILSSVPWMRHMNAVGAHIYLRPLSSLGIVLLDDLDLNAIARLRRDGLHPAVIVETSPGNYQCWIRLLHNQERREIPHDLIGRLLRRLADAYGTDPRSADWRHFGRLAGFTNQKPCHASEKGLPFVRLHYAEPIIAPMGRHFLVQTKAEPAPKAQRHLPKGLPLKLSTYSQCLQRILTINQHEPWAYAPDYSRIDFMIAREMLLQGNATEAIHDALCHNSPGLENRKSGHVQNYVRRTILAAARATFIPHQSAQPSPPDVPVPKPTSQSP